MSTILIEIWGIRWNVIFAIYAILAMLSTVCMFFFVKDYPHNNNSRGGEEEDKSVFYKMTAALQMLYQDKKMKYFVPFNVAFGFCGAFLNSFVSAEVLPVAFHDGDRSTFVGLFAAFHAIMAACMSLFFGYISQKWTGKQPIMIVGSLCFSFVALPFLLQPDLTKFWNWKWLVLIYGLEGTGRATFEGTLKAVFADYFPYEKEGAFANIILQNGLSAALGYAFSLVSCDNTTSVYCKEYKDKSHHDIFFFALSVVVAGILAVVGLVRASVLFQQERTTSTTELSVYRKHSIKSYTSSRRASHLLDRKTYESLNQIMEADDDDNNNNNNSYHDDILAPQQ